MGTHWNYTYDDEMASGDYESFYDMCGYECDYHSLTTTSEPEITTTTEQQSNGCVDKHIVCLQLQDKCTTEEIVWDSCQKLVTAVKVHRQRTYWWRRVVEDTRSWYRR